MFLSCFPLIQVIIYKYFSDVLIFQEITAAGNFKIYVEYSATNVYGLLIKIEFNM